MAISGAIAGAAAGAIVGANTDWRQPNAGGGGYGVPLTGATYGGVSSTLGSGTWRGMGINAGRSTDDGGNLIALPRGGTPTSRVGGLTLSTAGDISTGTFNTVAVASCPANIVSLDFANGGSELIVVNDAGLLYSSPLSTNFDIETSGAFTSRSNLKTLASGSAVWASIRIKEDGTQMIGTDWSGRVYGFAINTPYDWDDITYDDVFLARASTNMTSEITFDGVYLMTASPVTGSQVQVWELSIPWSPSSAGAALFTVDLGALIPGFNPASGINEFSGLAIDTYRKRFYIASNTSDVVHQLDWTG